MTLKDIKRDSKKAEKKDATAHATTEKKRITRSGRHDGGDHDDMEEDDEEEDEEDDEDYEDEDYEEEEDEDEDDDEDYESYDEDEEFEEDDEEEDEDPGRSSRASHKLITKKVTSTKKPKKPTVAIPKKSSKASGKRGTSDKSKTITTRSSKRNTKMAAEEKPVKAKKGSSRPKTPKRSNRYEDEVQDDEESDYYEEGDEEEYDEEDEEEYEDEDYHDNAHKKGIVIMLGGGGEDDGFYDSLENAENAEIEQALDFDNDECGSEDEKTFMKETYESFEYPKDNLQDLVSSQHKKKKGTKKSLASVTVDDMPKPTVEEEYKDLLELKRHLSERLKKNPHSKILMNTMKECCDSISKLVKKTRTKNAKDYFTLIKTKAKNALTEIDYFKKKLSHKEQNDIMTELKVINEHINIDKPYRLTLLQTKLPAKHKATVMQKLNMLRTMEPGETEYYKMKTWVETFMRIPFNMYKNLSVNISDGMDVCDQFMKNAKAKLDDCVYGLDDAKLQILQMVGQWITNPDAMGCAIAIHGPPGTGKCFALNTPILMYNGSIKMVQDVVEGDVLMGDDSTPRNVLGLGRGEDAMYEISNPYGESYTVNSEHILSLKTPDGNVVDITVLDYLKLSPEDQARLRGYKRGVDFTNVDPTYDIEAQNDLWQGYEVGISCAKDGARIPREYLTNRYNVRKLVLHGLLDTSGAYFHEPTDSYHMVLPNPEVLQDAMYLIRSMGIHVEKTEATSLTITGASAIARSKMDTTNDSASSATNSFMCCPITVRAVGRDQYYGFEIDGNKRFLLGDFTVTHNTSLAKEGISQILGREFAFMALGGAGDSSVLEGHSYTYEGSTWGRIVQILIDSKCMNPVIYFDELDKLSDSARGQEIAGILTHLTDKSQNSQFHDKYFSEVDFDLSKCLFIFSYNDENAVNPILRDRMYRIKTRGYDTKEKLTIAKKYMLPKIREQINFKEGDIIIPDDVLQYIITNAKFTQNEQGVRNLSRCLEIIHTKLNLFRLMHVQDGDVNILGKNVDMKVTFPYTVTVKDVDVLVRQDENQNQSLCMMYV